MPDEIIEYFISLFKGTKTWNTRDGLIQVAKLTEWVSKFFSPYGTEPPVPASLAELHSLAVAHNVEPFVAVPDQVQAATLPKIPQWLVDLLITVLKRLPTE